MASSRLTRLSCWGCSRSLHAAALQAVCAAARSSAFDGKTLTVDGKTQVLLGETTDIVFTQPIALSEISRATSSGSRR